MIGVVKILLVQSAMRQPFVRPCSFSPEMLAQMT
jgi:hypothetical protein